ncbi:tetratricopeptide repeat protein [Nocardiopsis sp. EMB25]|uniref:AfsR/SARP family transcriptional regulator n=1 Tax=Nocardiopsis sp. EMB25 TaxID=2835867 RepID=UPI00228354AD|nr:BTAD domain-containing putative transcriptional regulator [Nocardiopsis sp. EMB25]MCY9782734.1 tetratricopeptide repeat protein [Nocardiopsis sp. EMB25]
MRFGVLGQLAVWTDEDEPVNVPGAKVRSLLAHLLVHREVWVSADRLGADLWQEPPPDPAAALQTTVSRLRRALEGAEPGYRSRVESGPSGYRLRVDAERVDAGRFEDLVARARGAAPAETADVLGRALALWRGPALADHADAPFTRPAVTRWEEMRLSAVEDRLRARLDLGEGSSLVPELDDLVDREPLRERLRAAHMLALYRAGRQSEALESYRRMRDLLSEEVGVDPGPELVRLHQDILAQAPALARPDAGRPRREPVARPRPVEGENRHAGREAPPPRWPGNVPAPLTEVIGRKESVERIRGDVERFRLVTLIGPGGVGKTTLALAAVPGLAPSGVWFVELGGRDTGATTVHGIAEEIATAVGLSDEGCSPGRHSSALRLGRCLGSGLLVLDNCEHVIGPVAELVAQLLRSAPDLRILTTSREPLGVPGERLHQVRPLPVPRAATREALAESAAVELFSQRVAASLPGFAVAEDNAAAVAAICWHLDGLPLALELAAARVRSLGVHELAARLNDRFQILGGTGSGRHERQRTLHAVVDWSWRLLSADERAVLRRLSVHAGPFDLVRAEAIAGLPQEGTPAVARPAVVGVLASLVDRSLVVAEQGRRGARYRLLETIRVFARERLVEAGEETSALRALATHLAGAAAEFEPRLFGSGGDQGECLEWLDQETANLRASVEWAAEQGEAGPALRITGSLGWYWYLRGRYREGHRLLSLALATPGGGTDEERAVALLWHAALSFADVHSPAALETARAALDLAARMPDPAALARARVVLVFMTRTAETEGSRLDLPDTVLEEALAVFEARSDQWWRAFALHMRGWRALRRSELAEAGRDGRTSLSLFEELGEPWGRVRAGNLLGVLAGIEGDYAEAARLHRDALDQAERIGLWPSVVEEHTRIARVHLLNGDLDASDEANRRAIAVATEQGLADRARFARAGLGLSARRRGRVDEAEEHFSAVLASHREDGYRPGLAFILAELGFCAEMRGDLRAARERHAEGLEYARQSDDPRAVAFSLEGLAGVAAAEGDGVLAARLLGAAASAREDVGVPLQPGDRFDVDRLTRAVHALIGTADADQEFAFGHTSGTGAAIGWTPARAPVG